MRIKPIHLLWTLMLALTSCVTDAYDSGDGSLSYMRAEFVEARTDADTNIVSVVTDRDEALTLTYPVRASWTATPDTTYRALLYYNQIEGDDGVWRAEPIGLMQVYVPPVTPVEAVQGGIQTDPVTFESAWKSSNGKYINLGLYFKTGMTDGSYGSQIIGMTCDSIVTKPDGGRHTYLCLYHDQNGTPEYYSTQVYVSVAVSGLPILPETGDEVTVRVNTYDGMVERTFGF